MAAPYVFQRHTDLRTTTQFFNVVGTSDPLILPLSHYPSGSPLLSSFLILFGTDSVIINRLPLCKYFQLSVPSLPQLSSPYKNPNPCMNSSDFRLSPCSHRSVTDHRLGNLITSFTLKS